jgi:hypothetical protein
LSGLGGLMETSATMMVEMINADGREQDGMLQGRCSDSSHPILDFDWHLLVGTQCYHFRIGKVMLCACLAVG